MPTSPVIPDERRRRDDQGAILPQARSSSLWIRDKVDVLRRLYDLDVNVGRPQVAYRETLTRQVEQDHSHKRQSGGVGEFARLKIVLLEPIMTVEIIASEEHVAAITGDLAARRGTAIDQDREHGAIRIKALVPLADMLGHAARLRFLSEGRATFAMRFAGYEPAPSPKDDGRPPPAIAAALRA